MANYHADIQQLYVAYFKRPADVAGLEYWDKIVTAANGDLSAVSAGFAASAEFAARYVGLDALAIDGEIFDNLFGRPLRIVDGHAGLPEGPVDKVVKYFVDGAQGADKAVLDNRVEAALGFTAALDTPAESAAYAGPAVLHAVNEFISSIGTDLSVPDNFDSTVAKVLAVPAERFTLTKDADILRGTSGNDSFSAPLIEGAGTVQAADRIDAGVGDDRLNAELSDESVVPVKLASSGLETVSIHAMASLPNSTPTTQGRSVLVEARMTEGVTRWESNGSNTDLLIDGIRTQPGQSVKDITLAMVDTGAGNVDFGAYFAPDVIEGPWNTVQLQLMNPRTVMDGTPLAETAYWGFQFYVNGELASATSPLIDSATTYGELKIAVEDAIRSVPALRGFTVTTGGVFTAYDVTGTPRFGDTIVLTAPEGTVITPGTALWISPPGQIPGPGAHQIVRPSSAQEAPSATIVLDNVGRGGTGGDLVVGSQVGGIARFDIEVRDSSALQVISSTDNTLREVVFTNGETSDHGSRIKNRGDLTVLCNAGAVLTGTGSEALPHAGAQHNGYGFSDVRVIDASAMNGRIGFDAEITKEAITKYLFAPLPQDALRNGIDFIYSGGANDDSMTIAIENGVLNSKLLKLPGGSDMSFSAYGGAGNDDIGVAIGAPAYGSRYVLINGGAGNDTVRMRAGDFTNAAIVFDAGGFGNDKVIGFAIGAGGDELDFTALGGQGAAFSGTTISNANGTISVQLETTANDTAAEIAALYTDGASATQHVFVAYDGSNVGKVYAVTDGATTGVVAALVGSVDLSETLWSTLTSVNFS